MNINKLIPCILLVLVGLAIACPDYCNDCDPSQKICFACKQDYELSVLGKCVSNVIDKCIVYGPTNQCFVCQPSFELSGGRCVKQYSGCLRKNTMDNQCYECGFGKGIQNNFCVGSINCNVSSTSCETCAPGFELRSDGNCYDISEGCEKVGDNFGTCGKCKQGYKLVGYRCVRENIFVPYCYIYYNETSCEICKNGYSFFQNYCLLPVHIQGILNGSMTIQSTVSKIRQEMGMISKNNGTTTTTSTNTTTTGSGNNNANANNNNNTNSNSNTNSNTNANSNANTNNNNANSNSNPNNNNNNNPNTNSNTNANTNTNTNTVIPSPTSIPNCANQNSGLCLACNPGFVVSNNTCQQMDPNCGSYELTTGKCVSCIPNYQFASNGICVPKQVVAKIINCQVTDPKDSRVCLICTYGFFPSGNTCAKVSRFCDGHNVQTGDCFACKFGFDLVSGKCIDKNCLSYGANEICATCSNGNRVNPDGNCQFVDPNCVTSTNGKCDVCSQNFYPSAKGTCFRLPANCQFGNVINEGSCAQCINGYSVQPNGSCTLVVQAIQLPNCAIVQGNVCQACNSGFYVKNGGCSQISKLCSGSNPTTGACTGCLTGYTLISGGCYDLNCLNQADDKCIQCKQNYRINPNNNLCILNDSNCLTMGAIVCASCNQGFAVGTSGLCEKIAASNSGSNSNSTSGSTSGTTPSTTPGSTTTTGGAIIINDPNRDPNCKDYSNNKCNICSNRYYIGPDGKCIPVNAYCDGYNPVGACTSCYRGFSLSNGNCIPSTQDDPYCKGRNSITNSCIQCYNGYWLNGTKCTPVNPLCATSNLQNGQCNSCYPGYSLVAGSCGVSFKDPNCQQYNNITSTCNKCAVRYFYDNIKTKCMPVNILCQDFNQVTGACTSCYSGYKLTNGQCLLGTAANTDVNCKMLGANGLCVECYNGFYVKVGKCEKLNLLCATSNMQTGACLTCYQGYTLSNGNCVLGVQQDTNCKQFIDSTKKQCKVCYDQFYPKLGICTKFNDLCKGSNPITGACLDCYQGYSLMNGDCVIAQTVTGSNSDVYCIKWNNNMCVQCSSGFFYSQSLNKCQQTDPLCKTTNQATGICIQCYQGYVLSGNSCIIPVIVQIPFCQTPSVSGTCVECIDNYYLKNNICTPVSILCGGKYNKITGQCTGCTDGYFLQGGECIYPAMGVDPACERYSVGGFCQKCSLGFYLLNFKCTQIDNYCTKFDYARSVCLECYNKTPQGAGCL